MKTTLPITGGTGAYLGASGQVMVHTLKGKGNPTDVTVELEQPLPRNRLRPCACGGHGVGGFGGRETAWAPR